MKAIFKLAIFSLVLNLAVGIMSQALPILANDPTFNPLEYDSENVQLFSNQINGTINPSENLEDKGDSFDRLLDSIGIGAVKKVLNAINTYLFGFVTVLEKIFGVTNLWFMGFIRIMMTIGYAFGAFWLWTGKDIGKG